MPRKPLRQLAAEKARGNQPANPSQLGDPIDLKAETSEGPDPPETEPTVESILPTASASASGATTSSLGEGRKKQLPWIGGAGSPDRGDVFVSGGGVKGRGSKL
ncbi:hypothetical protein MMYC01_207259 [Madurella mycetomatis]|uniref:Uncharacterized protein n=1 Tax=Madurella mycetomatis TaxID=100816 RepID=A0A175VQD4_9PEZI|nr:hypothetical protein MMYC01_210051 [Madurella mycetomatis]KXX76231.1 hypothetical protein MMYC01_207259 [Madurella mycetomatis]